MEAENPQRTTTSSSSPPTSTTMFSSSKFQLHEPHHHHHLTFPHDSPRRLSTPPPPPPSSSDGATIEVSRRPRGRPPGSKNKPKPPVIITREAPASDPPAMSPYILEAPAGCDLLDSISRFCSRKNIGLCILTGSGSVANVTLRQPSTTAPGATVTFHGRFDILSVSGTFFPRAAAAPVSDSFTISLAGPQGQIVGGIVAGTLVTVGTVFIIAATFNSPSFHRLADDREGRESGSGGRGELQSSSPAGSGEQAGPDSSVEGGGGGMQVVVHGGNLRNEVLWPLNCRAAPPTNEIMWGDITASPSSGGHPPRHVKSEGLWPPNGRHASARSPPPY